MAKGTGKKGRRILVPVDETSEGAEKAFKYTVEQVYRDGDKLHLFHCLPPGQHMMFVNGSGLDDVLVDFDDATKAEMEKHARERLDSKFLSKLEEKKIPFEIELSSAACDANSVGSTICERAHQLDAIVVMAKHPKGAIEEFFSGSSTNYCVHHCKKPLLVLHCEK